MATNKDAAAGQAADRNEGALSRLRSAAGYRSGREFARALGISPSTYARYERDCDGPNPQIPIRAAWMIADKLDTSIDAVVGREGPAGEGRGLDAFYETLSEGGRAALDEYVRYLDFRERILAAEGR